MLWRKSVTFLCGVIPQNQGLQFHGNQFAEDKLDLRRLEAVNKLVLDIKLILAHLHQKWIPLDLLDKKKNLICGRSIVLGSCMTF